MTIVFRSDARCKSPGGALKIRLSSLTLLVIALLLILSHSGFFKRQALIGNDTQTYVDLPGLASGISLSNFSSRLRAPGFGLFMAIVTFGKIPNPNVVTYKICDSSVFGNGESCDTATSGQANTVKLAPLIYGYSNETAALFQRIVIVAKSLFVLSLLFLFWALSLQISPLLAAASVAFVCWQTPMPLLTEGSIYSELLFPALIFIYISCVMVYLANLRGVWLVFASGACVACFFVKPAFIYLIVLHASFLFYAMAAHRAIYSSLAGLVIPAAALIWFFAFSPINFFDIANYWSLALRTAILSDARTVACVTDGKSRTILAAYLKSIDNPSIKGMNYLQRYYALAAKSAYALERPDHPIYQLPEIQALFNGKLSIADLPSMPNGKKSGLPPVEIQQMLGAAERCNRWRNVEYMLLTTRMVLGLTPALTPFATRTFFESPYAFYLSCLVLVSAVVLLLWRRKHALPIVIAMCVGIYLSMVFVVALKQGGENRYTDTVEPIFVLGVAIAASILCSELLQQLTRRVLLPRARQPTKRPFQSLTGAPR